MDTLVERCGGLDVHKAQVTATVRIDEHATPREQHTRTFSTTTRGLLALADWLASWRVTRVGMEATGVYWKPVYYALEDTFDTWLLNAQHLKNVPGRKTDVADSVWIAQLVAHGLVRPSFVPPKQIRELRDLTRYRKSITEERTRAVQRLDKVLQDAGIKLTSVASETLGVSARSMLEALVSGTHDPDVLADLARGRLRAKLPALREALEGHFRTEHHGLMIAQVLAHIDFLDESVATLSARVEELIAPFSHKVALLCTIPGVAQRTAEAIIAEIGVDMTRFATSGHLASWAGVCPGNNESAGRRKTGRSRKGDPWLRKALTEAAKAAARSKDVYLAAQYHRLRGRKGPAKATGAVRHSILVAAWHILSNDVAYAELGSDYYDRRRDPERETRALVRKLERMGHTVTLTTAAAA
jgi:transposase